jgi:hypothetical protein
MSPKHLTSETNETSNRTFYADRQELSPKCFALVGPFIAFCRAQEGFRACLIEYNAFKMDVEPKNFILSIDVFLSNQLIASLTNQIGPLGLRNPIRLVHC